MTIKISYSPLKKYVVYKTIKYSTTDELARRTVIEGNPMSHPYLKWIDGLAYRLTYPASAFLSENLVEQFIDGIVWVEIEYAEMPKIDPAAPVIRLKLENTSIPVLDNSNDVNETELITWLKNKTAPKKKVVKKKADGK